MRMKRLLVIILICLVFATLGCSIHRIDIQQGNVIEPEQVERLEIGMTREQVRFLLGTPAVRDPFHAGRWDYVFYFKEGTPGSAAQRQRLTLYFEDDRLVRIDTGR